MNSSIFRRFPNVLEPFSPESSAPAFEWQPEGIDLLLRPPGGDLQIVWAYLGRHDLAALMQIPRRLRVSGNKVRGAFRARRLWRMWPLPSGETAFLRGEFGLLRFGNERELVRFELPKREFKTALEAFEASGERLESLFERLELDPASDWNAAKKWHYSHLSDWGNLEFGRGTPAEFERVAGALTRFFLDPNGTQGHWRWQACAWNSGERVEFGWICPSLARDQSRQNAVERVMEAHFDIKLEADAWRGYDWRGDPAERLLPHLQFEAPTMHEQMEAQLFLRDWLRDKMPAGEIKALLETRNVA